jgi:phospholipase/lecithinase/hemolysin
VIFSLDIHTLFADLIAGRLEGFRPTNTTDNIITAPDFSGLGFAPTRNITPATPAGLNPDNYVFWDQIHPTSRTHRAIGDYAVTVIPTPSAVVLFAAGIVAQFRRRR